MSKFEQFQAARNAARATGARHLLADNDSPEVCLCGATFADGTHLAAVKAAHLANA